MTYELCKQLYETGFPFRLDIQRVYIEDIPVPTLSELISACGDDFVSLDRTDDGWLANGYLTVIFQQIGDTPEIAVANLWLSLNSKQ